MNSSSSCRRSSEKIDDGKSTKSATVETVISDNPDTFNNQVINEGDDDDDIQDIQWITPQSNDNIILKMIERLFIMVDRLKLSTKTKKRKRSSHSFSSGRIYKRYKSK